MSNDSTNDRTIAADSDDRVQDDNYDRHITPAETAARKQREGAQFKSVPTEAREASAATDDQTDGGSVATTDGYTVDKEGLLNNYAIEPEMYYEVPGDAAQAETEADEERVEAYRDINQDEKGKLTSESDQRGRGPGVV